MIQPDYVEIVGPTAMPPPRNFPQGYLAGSPVDELKDSLGMAAAEAFNKALQGGAKGSPERADRVEFYSDVLSQTGQKFVASPKGIATIADLKGTVQKSITTISIPLFLAGLALGYLLGTRKK